MTYEEAIENLKYLILEMAKEAIEKQIPKNPIVVIGSGYHESEFHDDWWYSCPTCGNDTIDYPDHHCTCGQKLNWEWETI